MQDNNSLSFEERLKKRDKVIEDMKKKIELLDKIITTKEKSIEEQKIRAVGGLYAVEIDQDLPPLETMKYLTEEGTFSDVPVPSKEDKALWYRRNLKKMAGIGFICSVSLAIILLSGTDKYANGIWDFLVFTVNYVISFILGFLPKDFFAWWPF